MMLNHYDVLYEMAQQHQREMLEMARQERLLKQRARPRRSLADRMAKVYGAFLTLLA